MDVWRSVITDKLGQVTFSAISIVVKWLKCLFHNESLVIRMHGYTNLSPNMGGGVT